MRVQTFNVTSVKALTEVFFEFYNKKAPFKLCLKGA